MEEKILISTKASRAVSKVKILKIQQMFDEINTNNKIKLELIKKIYNEIKHPALKFLWDEESITDLMDIIFPLKNTWWFNKGHYRNLTRNPTTTLDKFLLFGGYPYLDLATQFTFLKRVHMNLLWIFTTGTFCYNYIVCN